jgi:tetratricopeptide (TPR) repeat protein
MLAAEANDPAAEALEAHVEDCPACQQALEELSARAAPPRPSLLPVVQPPLAGTEKDFLHRLAQGAPTHAYPAGGPGPSSASVPEPLAVPGYEALSELGRGAMGIVYRAWHARLRRAVALKALHAGAGAPPELLARLKVEAEAVARLDHPGIVRIYEVGEVAGRPYLALELVEGGSLEQKLRGVPQPAGPAARLTEQLARAVHHAHLHGVVHRDLKPSNILLDGDGAPKVGDFGLAKLTIGGDSATLSGMVLGTASYMAPEQALGKKDVGPAADVYGLGAILYEMLTGRPPFRGETVPDTLLQVTAHDPVPPRRLQPKAPRDLETICLKCLAKAPHKRYPSAEALADDLGRFLSGRPIQARPVGAAERAIKWARRRPAAAALLAVSVAAALVVVAVLATANARERRQRQEAQAQRDEAERQRRKAQERFELARAAVDLMLSRVGEEGLAHVPQMDGVRRELLQDALKFYQKFLEEEGTAPEVRHETALAYRRVGDIQRVLGKAAEADLAYRQACALLQALVEELPERARYREELAGAHSRLGVLLQANGRPGEAETEHRRALRLYAALVNESPSRADYRQELARSQSTLATHLWMTDRIDEAEVEYRRALKLRAELFRASPERPDYRQDLARSHNKLGRLLKARRRRPEAEKELGLALELRRKLAADFPLRPDYRQELAHTSSNLGVLYREAGRLAEAQRVFGLALELRRKLAADFPLRPDYRQDLGHSHYQVGALLAAQGKPREAESAYRLALAAQERLTSDYPTVPDYHSDLGQASGRLAGLLSALSEWVEAGERFEEAIRQQRAALGANPRHPLYRWLLRNHLRDYAESLIQRKDHAGAARVVAELPRLFPGGGPEHRRAARLLARCVPLAKNDLGLPESRREELAQAYRDQASKLLRTARGKEVENEGQPRKGRLRGAPQPPGARRPSSTSRQNAGTPR